MEIVSALIGVAGTLLAVFIGHWLANKKSKSEKTSSKGKQEILYDSEHHFRSYDVASELSKYDILQSVIIMEGEHWESFELRTYFYNGKEYDFIPKNELISGYRKFHVSCEFKVTDAPYEVSAFLWQTPEDDTDPSVEDRSVLISNREWTKTDFHFKAPPYKNYRVTISVERISGSGSVQIRNILVSELLS